MQGTRAVPAGTSARSAPCCAAAAGKFRSARSLEVRPLLRASDARPSPPRCKPVTVTFSTTRNPPAVPRSVVIAFTLLGSVQPVLDVVWPLCPSKGPRSSSAKLDQPVRPDPAPPHAHDAARVDGMASELPRQRRDPFPSHPLDGPLPPPPPASGDGRHDDSLGAVKEFPQVPSSGGFDYPRSPSPDAHAHGGAADAAYGSPLSSEPSISPPASRLSDPSTPPPSRYDDDAADADDAEAAAAAGRNHVVIKVGMVGDAQIGKTSLMVKYVEGSWDEDYIQTLGVNFMEKTISIRNTEITFSIWDLGGQREFVNMLPLVCNDAVAILFMFDLTRKSTLNSIKEWYRQGRGFNKTAIPLLVGTKYDHFVNFPLQDQEEISNQAIRFAKAMRASLIFSSTSHSINVQKIFKIVLSKAFDLKCTIPEIENVGEPLLLYQAV
ncbi:hypothetical protein RJ55_02096 [Drechmeria coniospora]|nr:hypothetical protein RJ55_02096 [Drechmeria coniospora]